MQHKTSRWFKTNSRRTPLSRTRFGLEYLEDRVVPAVIDVNTTADIPLNQLQPGQVTLRDAIQIANQNVANGQLVNTINLTVPGTYQISLAGTPGEIDNQAGEFAIFTTVNPAVNGLNLTIQNTSNGAAVIDGHSFSRVFDINPNNTQATIAGPLGDVTISGVTVQGGVAQPGDGAAGSGGGIRDQGAFGLTLNNDVITGNSASADGGGVVMENPNNNTPWVLNVNNTVISNNHAGDAGGGIDEDGTGIVNISQNSVITGNSTVNQGGGIWLDANGGALGTATLNITNSVISNNFAGMLGGGAGNAAGSTVTISNSTFRGNSTAGIGGGFDDQDNMGTLVVNNSLFIDNSAAMDGGAIFTGGPSTTITGSQFQANSAVLGGALFLGQDIIDSAVTTTPNVVTISNSTFADNSASGNGTEGGGGIEIETVTGAPTSTITITNTTIARNSALNNGGMIDGGGIDVASGYIGSLALLNDTITNNYADNGGGLFFAGKAGSTLTIQNTIIAQNIASTLGPDVDNAGNAGTFTDNGGNLIGVSGAGSGNTGFTQATDQTGTLANPLNPLVTGLQNNGNGNLASPSLVGATNDAQPLLTEALLPTSKAIAKGVIANAPTVDERDFARITPPDIGAYEFLNAVLQVNITASPTTVALNNPVLFTVTVTNAGPNNLPNDNSLVPIVLPAGVTASSFTTPAGTTVTVSPASSLLTLKVGSLAAGASEKWVITANAGQVGTGLLALANLNSPDVNPNAAGEVLTSQTAINVVQPTTVAPGNVTVTFNEATQQVTLTAKVTSPGGTVNEGNVVFTVGNLTATGQVMNGQATATLNLPGGFLGGNTTISAAYTDTGTLFASSMGTSTLTVNPANTTTTVGNVTVNFSNNGQQVMLTANVTSPAGAVNEGNVTFTLGNLTATGQVTNGKATATLNLPGGFAAGNYGFSASYADVKNANGATNFAASTTNTLGTLTVNAQTHTLPNLIKPFLLAFIDSLVHGVATLNPDGTVTLTDNFFGFQIVSTFSSTGHLMSVSLFGLNVTTLFGGPT
jgi:hypothetical protein